MIPSLRNLIKLCAIKKNSSDQDNFPTAQVTSLGAPVDAVQIQPYGLTSRPPDTKALGLMFNILGLEQNRMYIAFCAKLRKKGLKAGEVVLENMLTNGHLYLKENGDLEINIPENLIETVKSITINASANVTLNAATGTVSATALSVSVTAPVVTTTGTVQVGTGFGCNGKSPQSAISVNGAAAVNLAQVTALVNQLRQALIDIGIVQ